jgi:hypothetical protein
MRQLIGSNHLAYSQALGSIIDLALIAHLHPLLLTYKQLKD